MTRSGLILGIESSCDETAAAVVGEGRRILSSLVASQIPLHAPFRGVVPELAARAHEAAVVPLIREALERADCRLEDLEGVAVTRKPGLIGALLVGIAAAKALALARGLPLVGVDHLDAHIHSVGMGDAPVPFPLLAAVVSGGHTGLYRVDGPLEKHLLGCTVDDAAGEAFDKAAGLLGLPYPGGPQIEKAARGGKPTVAFPVAKIKGRPLHFSFSGLKTAVLHHCRRNGWNALEGNPPPPQEVANLAASFQDAVARALVETALRGAATFRPAGVALCGGVALNGRLREAFREAFGKAGIPFFHAPDALCGDNAAMVAGLGFHLLRERGPDGLDLDAQPRS
jgi:N6-L-threonylcarbamoyladenine synthase